VIIQAKRLRDTIRPFGFNSRQMTVRTNTTRETDRQTGQRYSVYGHAYAFFNGTSSNPESPNARALDLVDEFAMAGLEVTVFCGKRVMLQESARRDGEGSVHRIG